MIQALDVCKKFGQIIALENVTAQIKEGSVFGLIGSNGAGKSTFLRLAAGVLNPDRGSLDLDEQPIYENIAAKCRIFYISDEQYFYPNATPAQLADFYSTLYETFDRPRFNGLLASFGLDPRRKINSFSKGMKKQLSFLYGLCAGTDYLLCDETFDGLDPVMRQGVKSLLAGDMAQRGLTTVIASHSLRELEDICDHVGLLHRGGTLFSRDLDDMKLGICKVQCVFDRGLEPADLQPLEVMRLEKRGSLHTITLRASAQQAEARMQELRPVFYEVLPLSLEEIFISESEVCGYDVKKLLF